MTKPEKIGIIGAGLMGWGIAKIFSANGHPVWLVDLDEKALADGLENIRHTINTFEAHGIPQDLNADEALSMIITSTDMAEFASEWDFVIECVFENMELKQNIFADLDKYCRPDAILCSNTSVMSITEIASKSQNRQRIIGTHFWNPPYLLPLVEVIRTPETLESVADKTFELMKRAGKHPIHVYKDVPGFVANRLQHALWREAFAIIDEGICDPATVDEAIRNSFGMRLPQLGPVENADMVGLDMTFAIHDYILKYLNADNTPSKTLIAKKNAGELGFKSGTGFQTWTEEDIAASRQGLVEFLLKVTKDNT